MCDLREGSLVGLATIPGPAAKGYRVLQCDGQFEPIRIEGEPVWYHIQNDEIGILVSLTGNIYLKHWPWIVLFNDRFVMMPKGSIKTI